MRLPWAQAHPAKVRLTGLILANHVVAAAVLLYGGVTLGALLGVCRDPVAGLAVVVALLDPLFYEMAPHWIVPVLRAREAEAVAATALHRLRLNVLEKGDVKKKILR